MMPIEPISSQGLPSPAPEELLEMEVEPITVIEESKDEPLPLAGQTEPDPLQ